MPRKIKPDRKQTSNINNDGALEYNRISREAFIYIYNGFNLKIGCNHDGKMVME